MFKRKRCGKCNERISSNYNFCPYCRTSVEEGDFFNDEDWGMLGKSDFEQNLGEEFRIPRGINSLFNSLFKTLDNQMRNIEKPEKSKKSFKKVGKNHGGIGISIHTTKGKPPEIRVTSFGNMKPLKSRKTKKEGPQINLPDSNPKKFKGLPKEEPKTDVRRLSDKIIYEISMPGVKSVEDISISRLENSIEIKALGKNKVFQKLIPLNLPIKKYNFSKKKLTLELDAE